MSRICVKNLPKDVKEDRLRDFFSQKGEITDAKLIRTKEGKSRQFAFIGFRTEAEAEQARKYFDKSYLDTFRITCEIARKIGDPDAPRPWSQHSVKKTEKSTEHEKGFATKDENDVKLGRKDDDHKLQEFQEFLEVMQPRMKSKLWANDTVGAAPATVKDVTEELVDGEKDETSESEVESIEGSKAEKISDVVHDEVVSAEDYIKSKTKKKWSDSESDDDDDNDKEDSRNKDSAVNDVKKTAFKVENDTVKRDIRQGGDGENSSLNVEDVREVVLDTCRLFVRNLPFAATEEELEEHFSKCGKVSQVHIVRDRDTKQSTGIAYVLYTLPTCATRAIEELDSSFFQGRVLHVMPAQQKNPTEKQEADTSRTFKQKREDERKASEASGDTRAWNTLYFRPDTIVENIARKFGVSKSDFLDREADDLAVRISLGETQVIAETKKALTNAGINVDSLEEFAAGKTDGMKRSNHVILVKNLPYASSESELAQMFGKFGSLDKIIFPPTRTLALVVFLESAEARAAFKGLTYKRYKTVPLYLEWAPGNILSQNIPSKSDEISTTVLGENDDKRAFLEQRLDGISDADIDPDRVESRSLFVKNLNFETSDDGLRKHFNEHVKEGKVLSAKVKKHLKNGKNVSNGFGFVEFDSVETTTNVCRDLQGSVLDGHALILQLCHAKNDGKVPGKTEKDKSSTKLIVRNVAFEATEKELRQLFNPFGQIKSLRLPNKFGNHRGFAFVEFCTKQEAQNALQALSSTHFYGRHLVLEKAKEGESLEELRARTAAQFTDEQNGYQNTSNISKKRKQMSALDEGKFKFERTDF